MERDYDVEVCRTAIAVKVVRVRAVDAQEAKEAALALAPNLEFVSHESDYEVNSCSPVQSKIPC
jgi:hypothetical protein